MATKPRVRIVSLPSQIRVSLGEGALSLSADVSPDQLAHTIAFLVTAFEDAQRTHAALRGQLDCVPGDSVHVPDEDGCGYRGPPSIRGFNLSHTEP